MTPPISLPHNARFTCQSCGSCCQGWAVPVDQPTVERLRAHNWGADPFEPTPTAGEPYRIKLVGGRCFFLDPDNRCRIHSEISYDDKPAVCKSFPLSVLEVAGTRYARLSFWCPTVAANTGKPLEYQARWLKETSKQTDQRTVPLTINGKTEVAPHDFERIHQALLRFLAERSLPIADRLAAASALIQRLDVAATAGAVKFEQLVATAESEGMAALADQARRRGHPAGGRRVLTLYLLQDRERGRLATLTRLLSVLSFSMGVTALKSRRLSARATWGQLRRVTFAPSAVSDELLTRYLRSKLDSRRYVAGDATLIAGFNLLAAAYGMINVLSRMKAVSEGRSSCSDEDIRLMVRAADLLVVEHPSLDGGTVHRRLVAAALGGTGLCPDLLARLER